MLLELTIEKLKKNLPDLQLEINKNDSSITIPAKIKEIGDLVIVDDKIELTVYIGSLTHCHFGCYEANYPESQKQKYIAESVIELLTDLFNNKIIVWKYNDSSGGFYYIEGNEAEQDTPIEAPLEKPKVERYTWSERL